MIRERNALPAGHVELIAPQAWGLATLNASQLGGALKEEQAGGIVQTVETGPIMPQGVMTDGASHTRVSPTAIDETIFKGQTCRLEGTMESLISILRPAPRHQLARNSMFIRRRMA